MRDRLPRIPIKDWSRIDRAIALPDDDQLSEIANRWNSQKHAGQHRQSIVEDHRLIGLLGERAFARMFHLRMDLVDRKYGNRRANFTLTNGWRIDVVTRRPFHHGNIPELAVPLDTRGHVDAWVLVVWIDGYEPMFGGWITESEAKDRGRVQQFHERGVPNIVVSHDWLAPMSGLLWYHNATHPDAMQISPSWWSDRAEERAMLDEILDVPVIATRHTSDVHQLTLW